jgi:hypothetical protein
VTVDRMLETRPISLWVLLDRSIVSHFPAKTVISATSPRRAVHKSASERLVMNASFRRRSISRSKRNPTFKPVASLDISCLWNR